MESKARMILSLDRVADREVQTVYQFLYTFWKESKSFVRRLGKKFESWQNCAVVT